MNITYDKVSYFGKKKKNLHFIDLKVDDKSYGDLIIAIDTTLGSQLNNYCLETEGAIEVENTGEDLTLIAVGGDSLLLSIKDAVYVYFDTVAQQKKFTGYLDCLASANSNDENKVRYSLIFSSWIDENLAIFNQICEDYKNEKIDNLSIDYVTENFTDINWDAKVDSKLSILENAVSDLGDVIFDMNTDDTTTEDAIAELGSMISDIYAQLEELKKNG